MFTKVEAVCVKSVYSVKFVKVHKLVKQICDFLPETMFISD